MAVTGQLPEFFLDFLSAEEKIGLQYLKTESGGDQQTVDVQLGQIGKEYFNLLDIGLPVNTGVSANLESHLFGLFDGPMTC